MRSVSDMDEKIAIHCLFVSFFSPLVCVQGIKASYYCHSNEDDVALASSAPAAPVANVP